MHFFGQPLRVGRQLRCSIFRHAIMPSGYAESPVMSAKCSSACCAFTLIRERAMFSVTRATRYRSVQLRSPRSRVAPYITQRRSYYSSSGPVLCEQDVTTSGPVSYEQTVYNLFNELLYINVSMFEACWINSTRTPIIQASIYGDHVSCKGRTRILCDPCPRFSCLLPALCMCVLSRLRPEFSGHRTVVMFTPNSVYYLYATGKAQTRVPAALGAACVGVAIFLHELRSLSTPFAATRP